MNGPGSVGISANDVNNRVTYQPQNQSVRLQSPRTDMDESETDALLPSHI